MDEKRDETETELEGDLAIDDETAAEVTGGTHAGHNTFHPHEVVKPERFKGPGN